MTVMTISGRKSSLFLFWNYFVFWKVWSSFVCVALTALMGDTAKLQRKTFSNSSVKNLSKFSLILYFVFNADWQDIFSKLLTSYVVLCVCACLVPRDATFLRCAVFYFVLNVLMLTRHFNSHKVRFKTLLVPDM